MEEYETILTFWFEELDPKRRFFDKTLDAEIKKRFEPLYWKVVAGECAHWRNTARGRLAEILVLDQFARNMFRGSKQAFLNDPMALTLAQEAWKQRIDKELPKDWITFLYLPFMHSESLTVQEESVRIFTELGEGKPNSYAIEHRDRIKAFGRFPVRNKAWGRESTKEEIAFLEKGTNF